jgi:uncharacterized protein (TIGR03435 family)
MRRLALLSVLAFLLSAQTPLSFDVASIKPQTWEGNGRVGVFVRGDTLTAEHTCLYGLVEFAYNLRDEHLSGGPSWAKCGMLNASDLYLVIAKTSGDPPPSREQFRLMLQTLLAERFQLQVRHVQKDLPVYHLVAAPHGAKLKESAAGAKFDMHVDARVNRGHSVRITATHVSIAQLIGQFEYYAGRPFFDHTGLTGFYDLEIQFDVDYLSAAPNPSAGDPVDPSFTTVLEKQLGLKLEPATAPFDTVVIDRAEKPSPN